MQGGVSQAMHVHKPQEPETLDLAGTLARNLWMGEPSTNHMAFNPWQGP